MYVLFNLTTQEEIEMEMTDGGIATHSGVIDAVRGDRKGFKIGGQWFSVFRSTQMGSANAGDSVTFQFKKNKDFNNVQGTVSVDGKSMISITGGVLPSGGAWPSPETPVSRPTYSKGTFPIPLRDGQRSIIRQNALTNARELVVATSNVKTATTVDMVKSILHIAQEFEKYTSGDNEREAAESSVASSLEIRDAKF